MNELEYYSQIEQEETPQAVRLAEYLTAKYSPESVIDLGCATGLYLKPFSSASRRVGVEQSFQACYMGQVPILQDDITNPMCRYGEFDLVICLEVLEHIPADRASDAIKTIVSCLAPHGRIIFSAAIPGQGGEGHINCQPKEYWLTLFRNVHLFSDRYVDLSDGETADLIDFMKSGYHMGWLTQNGMVLRNMFGCPADDPGHPGTKGPSGPARLTKPSLRYRR